MSIPTSPSQTVGPYLKIGLEWEDGPLAVAPGTPGAITLRGAVLDGAGDRVPDGFVETWQADPDGRFDHPSDPRGAVAYPGFRAFGRCSTGPDGEFEILTLKPGRVPDGEGGWLAPHINVSVFARGLLDRVITRIYFADEPEANAVDPVLALLPDDSARATLIAAVVDGGYRFDVHLQGEKETVFFTV
jgi:protocatechuate 3,4-dioxygenase alpha subunit